MDKKICYQKTENRVKFIFAAQIELIVFDSTQVLNLKMAYLVVL